MSRVKEGNFWRRRSEDATKKCVSPPIGVAQQPEIVLQKKHLLIRDLFYTRAESSVFPSCFFDDLFVNSVIGRRRRLRAIRLSGVVLLRFTPDGGALVFINPKSPCNWRNCRGSRYSVEDRGNDSAEAMVRCAADTCLRAGERLDIQYINK